MYNVRQDDTWKCVTLGVEHFLEATKTQDLIFIFFKKDISYKYEHII